MERLRPHLVAGIPFVLSIVLSLSTAGSYVYWQDSGFYLTAVKEMGVLYPPGFVLYLLLCKAWTLLFFFLDFTYAVHLFSAACAAAAAGTLAAAVRDLLRSRGPLFRVTEEDPGPAAAWVGIAIGILAASGYTFWFSGLYAKAYSLYFLVLALLVRAMIRADESGRPRDFTAVALLIGLAWSAHPSATNLGLALVLFVAFHRKVVGWKGIAGRTGIAALAALGPTLLVPLFALRPTVTRFAEVDSVPAYFEYLLGRRILGIPGVFGFDAGRWNSVSLYFWEEFLGVGLVLVIAGVATLIRANRRLLLGWVAWILPVIVVTTLFKTEGQHDLWFVAAWLPMWMTGAVGLHRLAGAAARHGRVVIAGLTAAGALWAVLLNGPLLNFRRYDLAETFGRIHLQDLDKDAILLVLSDDPTAICRYLQKVKGYRQDVLVLHETEIEKDDTGDPGPAVVRAIKNEPGLRLPAVGDLRRRFPGPSGTAVGVAAFLNANGGGPRPLYLQRRPPRPDWVRPDLQIVPAGALYQVIRAGTPRPDARRWQIPLDPEGVLAKRARERGQAIDLSTEGIRVAPEAYEMRLYHLLIKARRGRANGLLETGLPEDARESLTLLESIIALDPGERNWPTLVSLGRCHLTLGAIEPARTYFLQVLRMSGGSVWSAEAAFYLGEIFFCEGRKEEARRYLEGAVSHPQLDPALRSAAELRLKSP